MVSHVIQSGDVFINQAKSQITVILRSSKTVTVILNGKNDKGSLCPVRAVSNFMSVKPGTGGGVLCTF